MSRTFPIQYGVATEESKDPSLLQEIPWEMIAPFEEQALSNHGQTLEELADRCGCDPIETLAIMKGIRLRHELFQNTTIREAEKELREAVEKFKEKS